jgi:5,10-methenyltetrahydrofolate synthetase
MTACEFTGDYKIGKYGIKEPVINKLGIRNEELGMVPKSVDVRNSDTEPVDVLMTGGNNVSFKEHFDFILVPGVAFSPNGYRLGRGKGYYDKFLSKYSNLFTVGVCFREQFYLDIPTEPHDIPMHKVIVC